MENKSAFYRWSELVCRLFPDAGPIATMMVVNAVCGHQVAHINGANPILWLCGGPASGKTTLMRMMEHATPFYTHVIGQEADWRAKVQFSLRREQCLVTLEEGVRFENELERDLFENMCVGLYMRICHQRVAYPEVGLYIDTKADRSSLLVINNEPPLHLPMTLSRSIVLELVRPGPVYSGAVQQMYLSCMNGIVGLGTRPSDEVMDLTLNVSGLARNRAVEQFDKESRLFHPRVVDNYVTLLALYYMLPGTPVAFDEKTLVDALKLALARQMEMMGMEANKG